MALTSRGEARATGCASAAGRLIFHRVVRGPGKGTSRALRRRFEIACPMENTVGRAASRKSRRSTARASGTLLTTIGPWPAAGWRNWPIGLRLASPSRLSRPETGDSFARSPAKLRSNLAIAQCPPSHGRSTSTILAIGACSSRSLVIGPGPGPDNCPGGGSDQRRRIRR